jgi:ubiquinone/menaquinone biosynthesis C-methylase UbiE
MHERRYNAEIDRLRSPERTERLEVPRVIDLCLEGAHMRTVLDVGTGSGLFAEGFAKKGIAVTGIDAKLEMVEVSRKLVPGAEFEQATVESIPFADKSFDLVFLGLVLHEADDVEQALKECRRCARHSVSVLEWAFREEDFGPPLEHRLKSEDVVSMAKKLGFKSTSVITLKKLLLYHFQV